MGESTQYKSLLESESFIEEFDKLENYVTRLMKNTKKDVNDIDIILTKQQLVDPNFTKLLNQNLLSGIAEGKKLNLVCIDKDLFFSEKEAMTLLQNYDKIKQQGGELCFHETMFEGGYDADYRRKLKRFSLGSYEAYSDYPLSDKIPFYQILAINTKLQDVAKKINEYSNKCKLSPYEKYLICFKHINNIEYSLRDFNGSRTYTGTIRDNKGCCVGKSQYLRILLRQCGINSCCIPIDGTREILNLITHLYEKYFPNELLPINGKKISLSETQAMCSHELKNYGKVRKQLWAGHCINLVQLDDDKYGLHGLFACDSTCSLHYVPIDDKKHLLETFNFTSYSTLTHGCGFEDFMSEIKAQDLSEEDFAKIEKEYFALTKPAIKTFIKASGKKLGSTDKIKLNNLLLKINKCDSFEQIDSIFDKNRTRTRFGKFCDEVYDEIFSNNGILSLTEEACENRAALEGCPLAMAMPAEMFESSKKIADSAYDEIFGDQASQESISN